MKLEKLISGLWASVLSFAVSFAGCACLVTGFDMAVELNTLALWCAAAAVLSSLCYTLPLGLVPASVAALAGGYLWQQGGLELSIQALLYRISRVYNMAYNCGIIRLNMYTADDMETMLALGVCCFAVLIAMAVSWAVCRRKPAFFGILLGLFPLGLCLVVTDMVPDAIYLWLLMLGVAVLMLTQTVRRQDEKQGNRLCALMSIPVALALLVLFAAVPQESYAGQERAQQLADSVINSTPVQAVLGYFSDTPTTGSRFDSNTVDLTDVGLRLESQAEMLRVTADYTGTLYLRGRALDTYDGWTWSNSGISDLAWPTTDLTSIGEVEISTRYAHMMLYLPYYTQSVDLNAQPMGIQNEKKLTDYSFACQVVTGNLADSGLLPSMGQLQELEQYIHLPDSTKKWAQELLEEIPGADQASFYHRAQAIAEYVRNSASYDTATNRMPRENGDFARWFLEESETGYCIHFATAATVLLQASGIPARYVTGYTAQVKAGEQTIVRLENSHAWVEYWLPGFGWMVLEATPAAPATAETETTVTVTEPEYSQETTQTQAATKPTTPADTPEQEGGEDLTALLIIAGVLVFIAGVILQRSVRLRLRQKKLCRGTTNEQALARWQEAAYLARVLGEVPDKTLFDLAQKAKFSQHSTEQPELEQFDSFIRDAHNKLRSRSIFHQFFYRMILVLY